MISKLKGQPEVVYIRDIKATSGRRYESLEPKPVTPLRTARELTVEELERQRHQKRQRIRREAADARIAERNHAESVERIDAKMRELDDLADKHTRRCEPIQNELAQLEAAEREALLHRRSSAEFRERRNQLQDELADANADLEANIDWISKELHRLHEERIRCAQKVKPRGWTPSLHDLFETGRADLKAAYEVAAHDVTAAKNRLELLQQPALRTPTSEVEAQRAEIERLRAIATQKYHECIDE